MLVLATLHNVLIGFFCWACVHERGKKDYKWHYVNVASGSFFMAWVLHCGLAALSYFLQIHFNNNWFICKNNWVQARRLQKPWHKKLPATPQARTCLLRAEPCRAWVGMLKLLQTNSQLSERKALQPVRWLRSVAAPVFGSAALRRATTAGVAIKTEC